MWGRLSDKYGRKPILIVSQIGTLVSFGILAVADSTMMLLFSRLLDGMFGGQVPTINAVQSDISRPETRSEKMAYMGVAMLIGTVFGPMILSGIAHVAGWVTVAPPTLFVIAAQITIGTIIGTRFVGATLAEIRRDISLSTIASLLMLAAAVGFAKLIVLISGIPIAQAFLAFSPGGLTEMSLLTLAMGQDVTYVSVMHIIRITLVIAIAPFVFKWTRRG